jgi:electron transport complex protein RnfB
VIETIHALLPQTQCTRCGYQGCRPYAEALVSHQADINQCPPGGEETIHALAAVLNQPFKALNPAFGVHEAPKRAMIIEEDCIGCTKCLDACPVDAIIGASTLMHTVITDECTGCELCISPCPVDCIVMETTEKLYDRSVAKQRHEARIKRLELLASEKKSQATKQRAAMIAMMQAKTAAKP